MEPINLKGCPNRYVKDKEDRMMILKIRFLDFYRANTGPLNGDIIDIMNFWCYTSSVSHDMSPFQIQHQKLTDALYEQNYHWARYIDTLFTYGYLSIELPVPIKEPEE